MREFSSALPALRSYGVDLSVVVASLSNLSCAISNSGGGNSSDGSHRAQTTRAMSGDRRSSGRPSKRRRSTAGAGGRPRNSTTPSVANSSRDGAGSGGRDNSLSGDPSRRAGPTGRTPASAVQPHSSGGSSSAGAAAIRPVRRSSRTNVAFATPGGLTSGSAQGPSELSSSNRSRKRQRTNSSDDHDSDDHAIGRGDHDDEPEDVSNQYYRQQSVLLAASAQSTRGTLHDDGQHQQRATNANHPRVRSAGTASGPTQPAAQTHAASRQEQPPRLYSIKRTKKKKQPRPKQGWNKGVSPDAAW